MTTPSPASCAPLIGKATTGVISVRVCSTRFPLDAATCHTASRLIALRNNAMKEPIHSLCLGAPTRSQIHSASRSIGADWRLIWL